MVKKKATKQKSRNESVHEPSENVKNRKIAKSNIENAEKPAEASAPSPDIGALKGNLHKICKIVTEKDFKGDKQAYTEFKNYCDEYDFHLYVVDKDGKRKEFDPKTIAKKETNP
jgi:hypothetical protein